MADYLFTILDSRTLANFSLSTPYHSPQTSFIPLPTLSLDNPRIPRRRRKKQLHLALLSKNNHEPASPIPSSSNFDIVSCHEHSDGSIIFRFGDPSVVEKDDELKESNLRTEQIQTEAKEEYTEEKVLDDNFESEVTVKKIQQTDRCHDSNGTTDVSSLMVVSNESSSVTEGESESSDKLLEDPKYVQLPVSTSSVEVRDSSSSVADMENGRHTGASASSVSVLEKSIESESSAASLGVVDEKGANDTMPQMPVRPDLALEVADDSIERESVGENLKVLGFVEHSEDQSVESGIQNVMLEDSSQGDVIEAMALSPSREAGYETTEGFRGEDTTAELPMINNNVPNLDLEKERSSHNVQSTDLSQVSNLEQIQIKSVEDFVDSERVQTSEFVLASGAALLPHPSKVLAGGEDAYFIAHQNWLGIADGVGQWSAEGSSPGVFAQELMENCENIVSDSNRLMITNPEEVLNLSVAKSQSPGLSTILVAHLDGQVLRVANIGDSGFIIVRNGDIHRKSSPMFHEFNFPLQIESGDDPSQLLQGYKIEVDEGDIIVIASDGLFDNLYDKEIASIVSKSLETDKSPKEIAKLLATSAQEVGKSVYTRSPFADAAKAAGYVGYAGGKLDDVAVIVSLVQKQ